MRSSPPSRRSRCRRRSNFTGDAAFRDTRADVSAKGTLANFAVNAKGTTRDAAVTADATLTPFDATPLVRARVAAKDVDVARFEPAFPATRLSVTLDAQAVPDGFAGTLAATNADAGAIDAGRVPLAAMNSRFRWDGRELALDDIDARLAGDARVTGRATLPGDGAASRWQLRLRDVDLQRVHSALVATRLSGTLDADVARRPANGARRLGAGRPGAELRRHHHRPAHRRRALSRPRRQRRGRRHVAASRSDGAREFDVTAEAAHFDPSRFGAFPAGSMYRHGQCARQSCAGVARRTQPSCWHRAVSSRAFPSAASCRRTSRQRPLRNVAIKLALASATLDVSGATGTPGDKLAFTADAPKVQELRALLVRYAGIAVPDTIAGALHVRGTFTSEPGGNGLDVAVRGSALKWGNAGQRRHVRRRRRGSPQAA